MVSCPKAEKLLLWKQKAMAEKYQKRRIFYRPRKGVKWLNERKKKGKERTKEGRREEGREGERQRETGREEKKEYLLHLPLSSTFKSETWTAQVYSISGCCLLSYTFTPVLFLVSWMQQEHVQSTSAPNNSHRPSCPTCASRGSHKAG